MKIVSVDCMVIDSGDPCKGRNTWNPVIIRINTDEGISGYGEVGRSEEHTSELQSQR